jgi:hypothetical protein
MVIILFYLCSKVPKDLEENPFEKLRYDHLSIILLACQNFCERILEEH